MGRKAELPTESTDKVRDRSIKDLGAGKQLVLLFKRKIKLRKFVISIQHCHRNTFFQQARDVVTKMDP